MDQKTLVELITREVLKQLQSNGIDLAPQRFLPLVVIDGFFTEFIQLKLLLELLDSSTEQFRIYLGETDLQKSDLSDKLQGCLVNPQALQDVSGVYLPGENELDLLLNQSSMLVLPWLPLATLAKIVSLQPDCPVSLLITKGLMLGREVNARKVLIQPMLDLYETPKLTPLIRRVQGLVSEARILGVNWLKDSDLLKLLTLCGGTGVSLKLHKAEGAGRSLLTEEDVQKLQGLSEIHVPQGTVITPLARDELRRNKIQLYMD